MKDFKFPENLHLVSYDAFSPEVSPEMWDPYLIGAIHKSLIHGGVLITYCAKGAVRRLLKEKALKLSL